MMADYDWFDDEFKPTLRRPITPDPYDDDGPNHVMSGYRRERNENPHFGEVSASEIRMTVQELEYLDPTTSVRALCELYSKVELLRHMLRTGPEHLFDFTLNAYTLHNTQLTDTLVSSEARTQLLTRAAELSLGEPNNTSPALALARDAAVRELLTLDESALVQGLRLHTSSDPFIALLGKTWLDRTSGIGQTYERLPSVVLFALNSHGNSITYEELVLGTISNDDLESVRGLGQENDNTFTDLASLLAAAQAL